MKYHGLWILIFYLMTITTVFILTGCDEAVNPPDADTDGDQEDGGLPPETEILEEPGTEESSTDTDQDPIAFVPCIVEPGGAHFLADFKDMANRGVDPAVMNDSTNETIFRTVYAMDSNSMRFQQGASGGMQLVFDVSQSPYNGT